MSNQRMFDLGLPLMMLLILARGLPSSETFPEQQTPARKGSKIEVKCAEDLDRSVTWCGKQSSTPADRYDTCMGSASTVYDRCVKKLATDTPVDVRPGRKTTEGGGSAKGTGDVGASGGTPATAKP